MLIIDIILLVILAGFIFYGFAVGLIRMIGSLVALVVGVWVASHYYLAAFDLVRNLFSKHSDIGKIISFVVLFILADSLVSLVFALLDRAFNLMALIPFVSLFNRLGGAILGLLEGAISLGVILLLIYRYNFIGLFFDRFLIGSRIAPFLIKTANVIAPLIPEILSRIKM